MRNLANTFIFFLITSFYCTVSAQSRTIRIDFNEKGQLTSVPPPYVTSQDRIVFEVRTTQDFYENRILIVYKLFQQTLNQLNQVDGTNRKTILKSIGLDDPTQNISANLILQITQRKLAEKLLAYLGKYKSVLVKNLDTLQEQKKLQVFKDNVKDPIVDQYAKYFYLPDLEQLT